MKAFFPAVAISVVALAAAGPTDGAVLASQSAGQIGLHREGAAARRGEPRSSRPTPPAFDPCLVGRWKEVGETVTTSLNGVPLVVRGGANRFLTFTASGDEFVDYRHQAPLRGHLNGGVFTEKFHGVTTYQDHTLGSILYFTHGDFRNFWITGTYAGLPVHFGHNFRNSPPARYTCTATRHTQKIPGYFATFVRVGAEPLPDPR